MNYRYYTHSGEYFDKWRFLSESQINQMVSLMDGKDLFYSIQTYTSDRKNKTCPIYADLDGPSAKKDAIALLHFIKDVFGSYPEVWNSGYKGYHVILPYFITHPKCERIALYILSSLDPGISFDPKVYTSRRMWRIPNSVNTKSGNRKVQVNEKYRVNLESLNHDYLSALVEEAKIRIKKDEEIEKQNLDDAPSTDDWQESMPPCISKILNMNPSDGERHNTMFEVARYFHTYGADVNEAIGEVLKYRAWYEYNLKTKDIEVTFKSVFNGAKSFGCKGNKLLTKHCSPICQFETKG